MNLLEKHILAGALCIIFPTAKADDGWFTVGGNSSPAITPLPILMSSQHDATQDLIEKGMTQDMVVALIGKPDEVHWDNTQKTLYHATYNYEVYKCTFSASIDRHGESSRSDIVAKYAAKATVYFSISNGQWIVYKTVGSTTNYAEYRKNGWRPIRRMIEPDGAMLMEKYK